MENNQPTEAHSSRDELWQRVSKLEEDLSSLRFFCMDRVFLLMGSDRDNRNSIAQLNELAKLFNNRLKALEGGGQGGQSNSTAPETTQIPVTEPMTNNPIAPQTPQAEEEYQGGIDQVLSQVNKMREKAYGQHRATFPIGSRHSQ